MMGIPRGVAPRNTQTHDSEATAAEKLAETCRLFQQPLLSYVTKTMLGDRLGAQDIVQETFLRAWRHLARQTDLDPAELRPWLFTVARHLVIDTSRARRARPSQVTAYDLALVADENDDIGQMVTTTALRAALLALSDEHRTVLIDLYFHGLSPAEIADRLGIPTGTVRSRTYYAKQALRAQLDT